MRLLIGEQPLVACFTHHKITANHIGIAGRALQRVGIFEHGSWQAL